MNKNNNKQMTETVRVELENRVKGMSDDELEVIVDTIPVNLCLERIRRELNKASEFDRQIKDIMNKYGKKV